jgi:hypothetical protein
LRRAWLAAATPERVEALADKLFELALTGDVQAARVWLEHVIGKPLQAVEVSGPDRAPLKLSTIVAVINEFIPDPETRYALADRFYQMSLAEHDDVGGSAPSALIGR